MKFNRYIWALCCENELVQKRIAGLQSLTLETWAEHYRSMLEGDNEPLDDPLFYPLLDEWRKPVCITTVEDVVRAVQAKPVPHNFESAMNIYRQLLSEGIECRIFDDNGQMIGTENLTGGDIWLAEIHAISFGLFLVYPQFFCPYGFRARFHIFRRICNEFDIPLPAELPIRANHNDRALLYLTLNQSLQEFRQRLDMTPAELCVFLEFAYDKVVSDEVELSDGNAALPEPMRVWFMTAGAGTKEDFEVLDNASSDNLYWQGNLATNLGDICLMWCVKPRSYLHSIWRATSEGFADPFFWGYSIVWIGQPIQIPPIKFSDIAAHPVLSQKSIVRAHFQGSSGKAFTAEEYDAILELISQKNFDISVLPKIQKRFIDQIDGVENERDVELKLVEPLLKDLGYTNTQWRRQLPIRMGRGTAYYPDYVFNVQSSMRGEEKADMVLEAKFRLANKNQLEEAYLQAKSYALRLQAKIIVLAALEGIWIYVSGRSGFVMTPKIEKTWDNLKQTEHFSQIKQLIGASVLIS